MIKILDLLKFRLLNWQEKLRVYRNTLNNSKNELETIFIRDESKIPNLSTREITVTEVRMSQDLKTAKIFVMPLGGKNSDEIIEKLKISSFMIRKVLSKKIIMKFLPKLFFVKDDSFDYAEKIENLIKQTNK